MERDQEWFGDAVQLDQSCLALWGLGMGVPMVTLGAGPSALSLKAQNYNIESSSFLASSFLDELMCPTVIPTFSQEA